MNARHNLQLRLAPWALLTVSAAWGLSFVVMKPAIERQSVNNFLFTRFVLAVLVMILIRPQVVKLFNKDLLLRGFGAGFLLGGGYIFQTIGLANTGAAITGFVTGLYVILTPLFADILASFSPMTREHHSVINEFLPRLINGAFFPLIS